MSKPMLDLPMDTKNHSCTCGGPASHLEEKCPGCGQSGMRVKGGTVRYLLKGEHTKEAESKIYGLCLSPDCKVAWYAQDGSHHFTTQQASVPIWTKLDADPVYACYCNEITRPMVEEAVREHGLTSWESIVDHYRDDNICTCALKNPSGKCCSEAFEEMIAEVVI